MKLSNLEIFGAVTALNEMFEMELPVRTSLALAKLLGKLSEPYAAIEKVRTGLVQKYGEADEKTRQTMVLQTSENYPKFAEEYNELMLQSEEIVFDMVKLPQKVKGEPFELKAGLLIPLQKFVELEALEST